MSNPLREAIVQRLNGNRRFAGEIIIDMEEGQKADDTRIQDLVDNERGGYDGGVQPWWQAYWTDGSVRQDRLGASVVQVTGLSKLGSGWRIQSKANAWHLGRFTGKSVDAELYGLAAALRMAVAEYHSRQWLRTVRVYTDAMSLLEAIDKGNCRSLGPIIDSTEPLAIQLLYDAAQDLDNYGIHVELHWVKAHAVSEMNDLADRAAKFVALTPPPYWSTRSRQCAQLEAWAELPQSIVAKGDDVVKEWRHRGNILDGELEDEPMEQSSDEDDED